MKNFQHMESPCPSKTGGGVLLPEIDALDILLKDGGSLQNGVLKIRTAPANESTWCVM